MREINDISSEDLRALEVLDQNCIDLHLCPPPKTFIQLDVEGPDGEKVESRKMRSQSWNRNMYNEIFSIAGTSPTNLLGTSMLPGTLAQRQITGIAMADTTLWVPLVSGNVGGSGVADRGIVIGASGEAESFEGYSLYDQYFDGTAIEKLCLTGEGYWKSIGGLANAYDIVIDPEGHYLIVATSTVGKYLVGFSLSEEGYINGLLPAIENTTSTNPQKTLVWSPDGDYFVTGYNSTIDVYKNNRDGTFTKLTITGAPSYLGTFAWSPDSSMLAVGANGSPYIKIYTNNGDDTFTAKTGVPALANTCTFLQWSPNGQYLAGTLSSGALVMYKNVAGTLSLLSGLPSITSLSTTSLAWTPDSAFLLCAGAASPYIQIVKNNGDDTFSLTAYSHQNGAGTGVYSWDSSGTYAVVHATSPVGGVQVIKRTGDTFSTISGSTSGNIPALGTAMTRSTWHPSKPILYMVFGSTTPILIRGSIRGNMNYAAQGQTTGSYDAETKKVRLVLSRVFNNNSANPQTVREVGIYQVNASGVNPTMPTRDVLAVPVEVPAAYKLTVTYTMEMTYPA